MRSPSPGLARDFASLCLDCRMALPSSTMTRRRLLPPRTCTVLALAALVGCRGTPSTPPAPAAGTVTFAKDVAPILFERCAPCHHPGGSAPFSVLDYATVKSHARRMVTATERRVMPPWLPEPGYGDLAGERRLADAQVDTIRRWVELGAVEGDRADLPATPRIAGGWQLGKPDLVVKLPRPFTLRAGGEDVWRNFVIPIPIAEARYVRTVELQPGSTRYVHHAIMAVDEMRSSRRRDEQDEEPGFEGMDMGDAHMPEGSLLGWTPGMLPFPGIEGSAWRLNPGTDLVLQLHMMPAGQAQTIDPVIGFYFSQSPGTGAPTYVLMLDGDDAIDIPPGEQDFVVTDTLELPVDVEVLAVYPHAHYAGKTVEGFAGLPGGDRRWLIRINRWDFKWQDVYRLRNPVPLPKGTTLTMRWTYDNTADNRHGPTHELKHVVAGNRSSDEMAHLQLQLRLRTADDRLTLQEAYFRHLLGKNPRNARILYGLAGVLKDQRRWAEAASQYRAALAIQPAHVGAHVNLGAVLVSQGRVDEAISHFLTAVKLQPDYAGVHYNLGLAFSYQNRLEAAERHYREALTANPNFAEAQNNLGLVLAAERKLDEAIVHYREAVRLLPDSADVHSNLGTGLFAQGNVEEAVTHFRRALAIDPAHADARRNLSAAIGAPGATRQPGKP